MQQPLSNCDRKQPILSRISLLYKDCRFCKYNIVLLLLAVRTDSYLLSLLDNVILDVVHGYNSICCLTISQELVFRELIWTKFYPIARSASNHEQFVYVIDEGDMQYRLR